MESFKEYDPVFGDWHIIRQIGEGSYAKVYEIEQLANHYRAALKVISIPRNNREIETLLSYGMSFIDVQNYLQHMVADYTRELDLMGKLEGSANILCYDEYKIIEHKGEPKWEILIRMELLTPLNKYIKDKSLKYKDLLQLGIQICQALEVCKRKNIVHRDIKPENIFVNSNGDYKLGDFGIALQINENETITERIGTYAYMAPEVYNGKHYGTQVDIYSLGLILYKMMNKNRDPFLPPYPNVIQPKHRKEAIEKRMRGESLPLPFNVDKSLLDVVMKACEYNPQKRYKLPSQMSEDLKKILEKNEVINNVIFESESAFNESQFGLDDPTIASQYSFDNRTIIPVANPIQQEPGSQPQANSIKNDGTHTRGRILTKLIEWVLYTCVLSLLPLFIVLLLSYFFKIKGEQHYVFISELLFFSITISVISIKDMVGLKLWKKEHNIFSISLFYSVFVLIIASILYGIVMLNGLTPIGSIIMKEEIMSSVIFIASSSFVVGTVVQIWEAI